MMGERQWQFAEFPLSAIIDTYMLTHALLDKNMYQ